MATPEHAFDRTLRGDATEPAAADATGLYAGRFRIEGLLGRGGMGAVYRAVDILVGDLVALKVLDAGASASQLEWFRREVRLARRISHPNVARTHDMGEQGGVPYISMELVEGGTLHDLLQQTGPLPPARAAQIAVAVCEGLAAAHAAGVVHRDLKPANVLLEQGGRVVLTDFGIARPIAGDDGHARGLLGTPLYMAPEQVAGRPLDARADVFALGVVLFEMLSGDLPFTGDTPLAAALARLADLPRDLLSLRPGLPEALVALVRQCLRVEPEDRPGGALEVAERLRGWLASVGEPLPGGTHPTPLPGARTPSPAVAPTLAVLPFRVQGPPTTAYLGDALADELVDVLSRTGGMRVLGSGATARYRDVRDPRVLGADLGADLVVDATVQVTPDRLRVQTRLVQVTTGLQLWNERIEHRDADPLAAQELISKRVAEALRVELATIVHRGDATPEAVALYLRARRKIVANQIPGPDGAAELLEACLRLAPAFQPAIAMYAVACARGWFFITRSTDPDPRDWAALARAALARAAERAPEFAETHFARGLLEVQVGSWRDAAQAFVKATELAPTYAHAHEYLAQLQLEAGDIDQGVPRAELAAALDPSLLQALGHVARVHALRGDPEAWYRITARYEEQPHFRFLASVGHVRIAGWYRDHAKIRDLLRRLPSFGIQGREDVVRLLGRGFLGEYERSHLLALLHRLRADGTSPRFYTTSCQIAAEILAANGHLDDAFEFLEYAADARLIDIDWLDRCPPLAPLRERPAFAAVRREVTTRASAMWNL